jgi:predicted PurR-regulated permease PerM
MSAHEQYRDADAAAAAPAAPWPAALWKTAIWGAFFVLMYLARDFFFVAFMTFVFCYVALGTVGWAMQRLAPDRERVWLRRLLIVAMFLLMPLVLIGLGQLLAPPLLDQASRLSGWLNQASAESEVSRLLEKFVGPSEFRKAYGGPADPRYQKALEEFRASGVRHVQAYHDFPNLEAWVEGGFSHQFADMERSRIRQRLLREGTSSKDFEAWFSADKVPELVDQAQRRLQDKAQPDKARPDKTRPAGALAPLANAALADTPAQLLDLARRDPAALGVLRQEWLEEATEAELAQAKKSPAYHDQFRAHYEAQRAKTPDTIPYTFEQFVALQKVRSQGQRAFGDALDQLLPAAPEQGATLQADFEAAKSHEQFQTWWGASPTGKFIRNQVETTFAGAEGGGRVRDILVSLINVPLDLATALLIGFLICIDYTNLRRAFGRLRETWLKDVYDEVAPALVNLGQLIGRSLRAQGMIALCNAILVFVALSILGVEHAVLLGVAVFVLCLVPTLGIIIAWALIVAFALVQPGGGVGLAVKASVAIVLVLLVETFVLSPRILGRLMELHPVLVMTILPVAQYFFGIKGLILAVPVAVYVVHVIILRRGLPGQEAEAAPVGESPAAAQAGAASPAAVPQPQEPLLTGAP